MAFSRHRLARFWRVEYFLLSRGEGSRQARAACAGIRKPSSTQQRGDRCRFLFAGSQSQNFAQNTVSASRNIKSWREKGCAIMGPLGELAAECNLTIIIILHPHEDTKVKSVLAWISGSSAFGEAPRLVQLV